ncbi:MAG: hypothetical protein WBZ36_03040 [Candidatus Nitrosopolaris sp.]
MPRQTEKEEVETTDNAEVEHLADESAIERKKRGEEFTIVVF